MRRAKLTLIACISRLLCYMIKVSMEDHRIGFPISTVRHTIKVTAKALEIVYDNVQVPLIIFRWGVGGCMNTGFALVFSSPGGFHAESLERDGTPGTLVLVGLRQGLCVSHRVVCLVVSVSVGWPSVPLVCGWRAAVQGAVCGLGAR